MLRQNNLGKLPKYDPYRSIPSYELLRQPELLRKLDDENIIIHIKTQSGREATIYLANDPNNRYFVKILEEYRSDANRLEIFKNQVHELIVAENGERGRKIWNK